MAERIEFIEIGEDFLVLTPGGVGQGFEGVQVTGDFLGEVEDVFIKSEKGVKEDA